MREEIHPYAVNHVAWCPSDENELITASFDYLKVWDLKKMDKPRLELRGHARFGNDFRGKTIYHPMYHSNGRFIVTPGEKSEVRLHLRHEFGTSDFTCCDQCR